MKTRKIPQRSCVGCRVTRDKKDLIRVVRTPEGSIQLDPRGKLPGRGAYICPDTECLKKAIKNKSLSRALNVDPDDDLLVELSNQVVDYEKKS